MNLNHIFDIFKKSPPSIEDYKDKPIFKAKVYEKLLNNYEHLGIKLIPQIDEDIQEEELQKAIKKQVYEKAWGYISEVSLEDYNVFKDLKQYNVKSFKRTLDMGIKYFESFEEYEKCLFLKNFKEKLE
jgi:hypothetical protein